MSAGHAPLADAIAFRVVAALETYEAHVTAMLAAWPRPAHYGPVSRTMDEMRALTAGLPALAVPFVTLLVAQAELMQGLLRAERQGGDERAVAALRDQLMDAIAGLRRRCLGMIRRA